MPFKVTAMIISCIEVLLLVLRGVLCPDRRPCGESTIVSAFVSLPLAVDRQPYTDRFAFTRSHILDLPSACVYLAFQLSKVPIGPVK